MDHMGVMGPGPGPTSYIDLPLLLCVSIIHACPYLSSPTNTLPDAEIHEHPGNGQCDGQRPADLSWLVQSICHLVHVAPGDRGQRKGSHRAIVVWTGTVGQDSHPGELQSLVSTSTPGLLSFHLSMALLIQPHGLLISSRKDHVVTLLPETL